MGCGVRLLIRGKKKLLLISSELKRLIKVNELIVDILCGCDSLTQKHWKHTLYAFWYS